MMADTLMHSPARLYLLASLCVVWLLNSLDVVFPPIGIPLALIAIWLFVRSGRGGWSSLGIRRPRSWTNTFLIAITAAVVKLLVVVGLLLFWVLPRAGVDPPDLSRFRTIQGNVPLLLVYLGVSWITAGFGEEVIWRGFSMGRIAKLFGDSPFAWLAALTLTSVLFGLLHAYQGPTGVILTGVSGFVFGAIYLATNRNLWIPIIMHGTGDTISFLILFFAADRL